MKILIIGSGAREHAIAWKIKQSAKVTKMFCAPGNAGTAVIAENVNIKADDINALLEFAKKEKIDLTCVGPEGPLVLGIADLFTKNNLRIFGPTQKAAMIEGSKVYAKELMRKYGIPTADFKIFSNSHEAMEYVRQKGAPIVIKADGLAAGKGVVVAQTVLEAESAIFEILEKKIFAHAGDKIVIEDALIGDEASILAISDGENRVILESSQDHKRAYDKDKGPNTGGMGAYSPAPIVTEKILQEVDQKIITPLIKGMKQEGNIYKGVIYAGIMITKTGVKALEFNARFGDPETQAILPRMKADLVDLMSASVDGKISGFKIDWHPVSCVSVVMASGGYPGVFDKNKEITGLDYFENKKDEFVFHAGTVRRDGKVFTDGGRVLNVVAVGGDIHNAIDKVYKACENVSFEKMHYRKDIGHKAL